MQSNISQYLLLSISPRCATIFSQPLHLAHADLKHQWHMEPWQRSEFAIDCQGTAQLINYQQCVRRRTKKYIFCIANKATFCKLITLQTCIVQFYEYLFLQTWHIPVANLVLGRCLLADNICVCELGLLKTTSMAKLIEL